MSADPDVALAQQDRTRMAEQAIENVQKLVDKEAQTIGKKKNANEAKETKDRVRKILTSTYQVIAVVEGASEVNPFAKAAVVLFKSLLKLEIDRKDNSEQIVAVFHTMSSMVFVIRFITARLFEDDEYGFKEPFEASMRDLQALMTEFGGFADTYYTCKPFVRFLRSGDFKEKLSGFEQQFSQGRNQLEFLLNVRGAGQLQRIDQAVQHIIDNLGAPTSPKELQAASVVDRAGGAYEVLENEEALTQIAKILGDRVTSSTQEALHIDLDELMNRNLGQFILKLQGAQMEVTEAIDRSRDAILHKLDEGPHDFINEVHIKEIWKANAWRLSVKCRQFVDAICNYYDDEFRKQADANGGLSPPDHWTLSILSKVIYHPAIGDAIDEDGSGFISVHEVNHFLKKVPDGWTIPQWFAYWAIGWQYTNISYTRQISEFLEGIQKASEATQKRLTDENLKGIISEYLVTVGLGRHLVEWVNLMGDDTGIADVSYEAAAEIVTICDNLVEERDVKIVERLAQANYQLSDDSQLTTIIGAPGFRIEQWMMCILSHLLEQQLKSIEGAASTPEQPASREELTDQEWLNMDASFSSLLFTFHARMKALLRGWRSQKIDVELQIGTFAGGVFEGWYNAYHSPDENMKEFIKIAEPDNADYEEEYVEDPEPPAPQESTPIELLARQVQTLESRLSTIETLLRTLVASSNNTAARAVPTSRGPLRGGGDEQPEDGEGEDEGYDPAQREPEDDDEPQNEEDDVRDQDGGDDDY